MTPTSRTLSRAGLAAAFSLSVPWAPSWAAGKHALPGASEVLEGALRGPAVPYEGTVFTRIGHAKSRRSQVRCSPAPDQGLACRREFVGSKGGAHFVSATDGSREWIFDRKANKVWEGPSPETPADPGSRASAFYRVALSTGGKVAGRLTWKLELSPRSGGAPGRRLWVDREQRLVLKDETVLPDGKVALRSRFSRVAFGGRHDPALFRPEAVPGASREGRLSPSPAVRSRVQAEAGFAPSFPSFLPSGFVLDGVDLLPYKDKKIIHCRYSDGAVVLSFFQSPPRAKLDLGAKDRREVRLASGPGFVSWTEDAGVLGWSSGETKLVLVAPLGLDILQRVAESVP